MKETNTRNLTRERRHISTYRIIIRRNYLDWPKMIVHTNAMSFRERYAQASRRRRYSMDRLFLRQRTRVVVVGGGLWLVVKGVAIRRGMWLQMVMGNWKRTEYKDLTFGRGSWFGPSKIDKDKKKLIEERRRTTWQFQRLGKWTRLKSVEESARKMSIRAGLSEMKWKAIEYQRPHYTHLHPVPGATWDYSPTPHFLRVPCKVGCLKNVAFLKCHPVRVRLVTHTTGIQTHSRLHTSTRAYKNREFFCFKDAPRLSGHYCF